MWPPLNASGEGSPHTGNGVSSPNNFQGHVHVRTCTNGITHVPPMEPCSGTFSPHNKWTYYLAAPTTCPLLKEGVNGTIPTQYNYQPSSLQANGTSAQTLELPAFSQIELSYPHTASRNVAPTIMPVEMPAITQQMESASPPILGEPLTTCIDNACPHSTSGPSRYHALRPAHAPATFLLLHIS